MVPYIQGISGKFKKLCKPKGIQVFFKGTNTLRTKLVTPKDKDPKLQKSGIIYHYKCPHTNCTEAYIGETGRVLGDRVSKHLKALHSNSTGHPLNPDCFNIIYKETLSSFSTIKEAMFIRVNDPMLNRNLGNYQLLHIWDNILQDMPILQLKPSSLPHSSPTPTPTRMPPSSSPHTPKPPPNHKSQVVGTCTFIGITWGLQTPPKHP